MLGTRDRTGSDALLSWVLGCEAAAALASCAAAEALCHLIPLGRLLSEQVWLDLPANVKFPATIVFFLASMRRPPHVANAEIFLPQAGQQRRQSARLPAGRVAIPAAMAGCSDWTNSRRIAAI